MCFAPQRRALFRHRIAIESSKSGPNTWCFDTFYFKMCFAPQRRALFRDRNIQKWPEHAIIWAFLLKMCFAPQRRALFRHRNVQKSSGPDAFCTFLLQNVLRATTACTLSTSQLPKVVQTPTCFDTFYFQMCFAPTTACTFSTSQFPKVVRGPHVFWQLLTSKCASRHNGVHFGHISTSKSVSSMTCFASFDFKMCFAPQRGAIFHLQMSPHPPLQRAYFSTLRSHKTLEKHSVSRLPWPFRALPSLLSSDFLHFWASPELHCIFHLSILSEV